ncbi:type I pullulanase [Peribacillus saganii]|uniref:Type I pullulanase n=1 Tax=Peribacillus saganii TaxID=2303992 RepID=A0A372LPX3_9BACI|nr:type I pullulanase [Peribacillus saganii]RFU68725.1 type I pullulanase [Peribacillus saganii]
MNEIHREFYAYLDDMRLITILLPYSYHSGDSARFSILNEGKEAISLPINNIIGLNNFKKYECELAEPLKFGVTYEIQDEHGNKTDLQIGAVIRSPEFDRDFFYDGNDLGARYQKEKTVFTVWAPSATKVKLNLIPPGKETPAAIDMERGAKGIWKASIDKDLEGFRYSYLVCVNLKWTEAVDPYANAVTVNGEMGVIVNLEKNRKEMPELPSLESPTDAIIYEVHIRDFTIHLNSGVKAKGKYLGLADEKSVDQRGLSTGLNYLKELGITHLELLPFNDFHGVDELKEGVEYNWGYNPLHYNAPDGSYSSDPTNPYTRITELRDMIEAVQKQGIRVIMDVVYNHVYDRESSHFEKIVPGYYFRHDEYGMPSNGTGVGNDIASERLMARKFIVDSIVFWMKEYNINGFRFDLMGILDVETMNDVRKAADKMDKSAVILGEGWDLNTPLDPGHKANIRNAGKLPRIAQFNDWFRDTVKGSTFNLYDRGYVLGSGQKSEDLKQVIAASVGIGQGKEGLFSSPEQSVNYVECHDNHTLWDKICYIDEEENEETKQRRHLLATSIVLLSQGIPFIHSGQEFFRTKQGVENSYKSPDKINRVNWDLRGFHSKSVDYIKGLICIRKSHGAFRLRDKALIQKHLSFLDTGESSVMFALKNVRSLGPWSNIVVLFHHIDRSRAIKLPEGVWHVICNGKKAGTAPIALPIEGKLFAEPLRTYILVQE